MSIKPVSDRQILQTCQQTCDKLKAQYVCTNDIIPRVEMIPQDGTAADVQKQYEGFLKKYQQRYVRFTQRSLRANLMLAACNRAFDVLLKAGRAERPYSPAFAAIKAGFAECEALTYLGCNEIASLTPCTIELTPETGDSSHSHCLALVGVADEIFALAGTRNLKILEVFERLKKGVILDISLGSVCLVSEYREKATPLLDYIKTYKTEYITYIGKVTPGLFDSTIKEAELVYTTAQRLFPQIPLSQALQIARGVVNAHLNKVVLPQARVIIQERFPALAWKPKLHEESITWNIWAHGKQKALTPIAEQLQASGIKASVAKVKDKNAYIIICENPDPLQLRIAFATEGVFGSAKDKGKRIINLIARYAE